MPKVSPRVATGDGLSLSVSLVLLEIPNSDWVKQAIITGLDVLAVEENWQKIGSQTPEISAAIFSLILQTIQFDYEPEVMSYPKFFLTHAVNFIAGDQGSLSLSILSPYHGINTVEMTPSAIYNTLWIPFYCAAGDYDIRLIGQRGANYGITDLMIDGAAPFAAVDWYNSTAQNNIIHSDTVTIVGDGLHYLSAFCNDKRAASSGYRFQLNSFSGIMQGEPS